MTTTGLTNKNVNVVAYYTEWSIYQQNFSVSQIPVKNITHILYAFMMLNPSQADYNLWANNWPFPAKPYTPPPTIPEGTLAAQDPYANSINIGQLKTLKQQYPNIKILICVGGWSMSFNFSNVFADATLRKNFVTSAVQFIVSNGFDGIDIDWEYPNAPGIGFNHYGPQDAANLVTALKELRAEFTAKSPNKNYILSVSMGTNPTVISTYKPVIPFVDMVNAMTYDYAGSWGNGGHLAALYNNPLEQQVSNGIDAQWNASSAIQNILNIGCPANKINMGLPMYARGWNKITPINSSLPLFGTSNGVPGKTYSGAAGEPGLTDWKDMVNVIGTNGLVEYYDPTSMGSFVHNNTTGETWSYDNPKSIALKTQYALNNKLGGVMFWELAEDTRNGQSNLLNSAVAVLNAVTPPTQTSLSVDINLTQSSSTGGTGTITITNNGIAQTNWSIALTTTNFTINSLDSLTMAGNGNNITISGPSINQNQILTSKLTYSGSGTLSATTNTPNVTVTTNVVTPPPPQTTNLAVTLQSTQFWGNGGNGNISITNNGTTPLTNWSFQLTTSNFTISSFWNLTLSGSGSNITISPPSWSLTINPSQTITSGFAYVGNTPILIVSTSTPNVNLTVINSGGSTSSINFTVNIKSVSNWGTGGNGQITITNNGQSQANWSFQLTTKNFTIQSFWALSLSGAAPSITVGPPSWSSSIAAGQTITSGFGYIGSSATLQALTTTPGITLTVN